MRDRAFDEFWFDLLDRVEQVDVCGHVDDVQMVGGEHY